jgi:hypothetical protein
MRCGVRLLVFLMVASMLVFLGSSLPEPEEAPQEAYDAARAFLQVLERYVHSPGGHDYAYNVMKLENLDDLAEARLGTPFSMYTISSSSLQTANIEASNFLENAKFCYYYFPVIIGDQYHGIIHVNKFEGKWTGSGYLGQGKLIDYICQVRDEHGDEAGNMYSIVLLDGSYMFAFTKISGKYYLKPENKHSASLLGSDLRAMEFKEARAFLAKYVSSQTRNRSNQ